MEDPETPESPKGNAETNGAKSPRLSPLLDETIADVLEILKASENKTPQTLEEFMNKVIEEYGLKLPQLPKGKRYVWNQKTKKLSIESDRLTP